MEVEIRKWVLVSGAQVTKDDKGFRSACTGIGAALARAGFGVVGGSLADNTADAWIMRGAMQVDRDVVKVIIPGTDAELPEEFQGIAVETVDAPVKKVRVVQLQDVVATLLVGGRQGTRGTYQLATVPVVAVPAFGGAAKALFGQIQNGLLDQGVPVDLVESLQAWNSATPQVVVRVLEMVLGTRLTPAAYLLTWDPERTSLEPSLESAAELVAKKGAADFRWSAPPSVRTGDRVYLMRHGTDEPGLVGVGEVIQDAVEGKHWAPVRRKEGLSAWYVQARWHTLAERPSISLSSLQNETGETELWTRHGPGHLIAESIATRVDELLSSGVPVTETDSHSSESVVVKVQEAAGDQPTLTVPRIELESPRGDDLLGIDRDVNPLAAVIAARNLEPPLAIGLFGDWGSGKSFFMEKLHERIEGLADASRAREKINQPHAFHSEVVQIRFNAWNYVETNLWASLVTHIFESLHSRFSSTESEAGQQWERLLKQLDEQSELGEVAREELQEAEKGLELAKLDQRTHREKVAEAARNLWLCLEKHDEKLRGCTGVLDDENLAQVRDGLLLRRDEAHAILDRLPLFRRTLLRGLGSARSLGAFGGVLALGAAAAVYFASRADSDTLQAIGKQVSTVVAVVGSVSVWLGTAFRRASKVMDAVQGAEDAVYQGLNSGVVDDSKLREAELALEAASRRVDQHEKRIEELRVQLGELQPSRRLTSFLASRAESQDYRKHLGLPAMIRRDFKHLQELMDQMKSKPFQLDDVARATLRSGAVPKTLFTALRESRIFLPEDATAKVEGQDIVVRHQDVDFELRIDPRGEGQIIWKRLRIDRIVLYIDDLDRCPSKRVVEVLQAVRLLLDFELFVVVVGVDARWVTQALQSHHARQWGRMTRRGMVDAPEPQDFLEKVFQIPLWLEPLGEPATRDYLKGLTEGTVRDPDSGTGTDSDHSKGAVSGDPEPEVAAESAAADDPEARSMVDEGEGTGEVMADADGGHEEAGELDQEAPVAESAEDSVGASDYAPRFSDEVMNPPGLEMETWERDFMLELAGLLGRSPRAVKRFVNVYRLIRSSVPPDQYHEFRGSAADGAYRLVQLLLAVIVGKPSISADLFAGLRMDSQPGIEEVVQTCAEAAEAAEGAEHKERDWKALQAFLEQRKKAGKPLEVDPYLVPDWVERVSRYSFRVGRR